MNSVCYMNTAVSKTIFVEFRIIKIFLNGFKSSLSKRKTSMKYAFFDACQNLGGITRYVHNIVSYFVSVK